MTGLDTAELARQVTALYRRVAQQPTADFHFPLGRPLAQRLGYPAGLLDAVTTQAQNASHLRRARHHPDRPQELTRRSPKPWHRKPSSA